MRRADAARRPRTDASVKVALHSQYLPATAAIKADDATSTNVFEDLAPRKNQEAEALLEYVESHVPCPVPSAAESSYKLMVTSEHTRCSGDLRVFVSVRRLRRSDIEFVLCPRRFNELFVHGQYKAAAVYAAHSPRGILRNMETMERFRAVVVGKDDLSPLMMFFEALMESSSSAKHPVNAALTLEAVKCAVSYDKMELIVHWVTQQRITVSEALGDVIWDYGEREPYHKVTCLALAQLIYRKCPSLRKAALCMCVQGQIQGALDYTHQSKRFLLVQRDHFQFVALPFGLATAPRVFTKIMAALMAILRVRGLVLFPYLDDILIKAPSFAQAHESLSIVLDTLARFGWLVNRKKSCLIPSQRIIFLGMLLDTRQSRVFLPKDKRSSLCRDIRLLQGPRPPSLRSAMKVLGKMVATLEAIPFAQFHSRPLQQAILSQWDRSVFSLDRPIRLSSRVKWSLYWWLTSPLISQGRSFLPVHWQVVTTDASLIGWGAVFRHLTVQGRWSSQESTLPINVLEIRAIFLSLRHWERILRGLPVRIQTDNATAVAYVNHQGGTRSSLALAEVSKILLWAEATVPVISAVHIPGVDNWAADFLSREGLAAGEWSLHPEVFHQICLRWGTPDVDLTASRINRKVPQFVSRSRDPLAVGVDALAIPWSQFELPYLFPPLPLLPKLLKKIKRKGCRSS
ncbi:unnamed protein product [Ranitomeya imitator]|uniref:ribonuclease H n=1 Tax=Ranitomeya imitator TaxID=111125 RepID=A0ABN9LEZ0_9NEOB|nr:unnamed protein product [Ranitomeya imitator]